MAKLKLTKSEQKKQRDNLKQFQRYLPTLQLKKQQLQGVINKITEELEKKEKERERAKSNLDDWVAVFSENLIFDPKLRLENLVKPDKVVASEENIAGVIVPVFMELTFKEIEYDISDYPLWVDTAVFKLREVAMLDALCKTLEKQVELLGTELRITSQRVNLFERVKIPEAKENIRKIAIYLGDQDTSAVVRGKIAKKKTQEVTQ